MDPDTQLTRARAFFERCETGQGWDSVKELCAADGWYRCQALGPFGQLKTLEAYVDFMKVIVSAMPDARYELGAVAYDAARRRACFVAQFIATHTVTPDGVPLPPPTNRQVCADYVYTIHFNEDGVIEGLHKVFNDVFCGIQAGWEAPRE